MGSILNDTNTFCSSKSYNQLLGYISRSLCIAMALKGIPIVWVMGPPGCGKGAQCELLYSRFNFAHISSGELLRNKVAEDPIKYREVFKLMEEGIPVPNAAVTAILAEGMIEAVSKQQVVGFLV